MLNCNKSQVFSSMCAGGEAMKHSILYSSKFKLVLFLVIYALWSFFLFWELNSSLILTTLWLSTYVQLYFYTALVFYLATVFKAQGKFNKVNRLNRSIKTLLYVFVFAVHIAHAGFCGWVVYMVLEQNMLRAAVTGSVQLILNAALLNVKPLT